MASGGGGGGGGRGERRLVALVLVSSDILLALAMWLAAFVLQGLLGRWPLSAIAIARLDPAWMGTRMGDSCQLT